MNHYFIFTNNNSKVVKTNRLAKMTTYTRRAVYGTKECSQSLGFAIFWNAAKTEGVAIARHIA